MLITHAAVLTAIDSQSSWERLWSRWKATSATSRDHQGFGWGVMAGTSDLIQRGFIGSEIRDGVVYFDAKLLDRLEGLSFSMQPDADQSDASEWRAERGRRHGGLQQADPGRRRR